MIDIHSHILPGVDDGSKDMEMSLDMARIYLKNGITKVIATPHFIEKSNSTSVEVNAIALESLKKELFRHGLGLEVFLGNEVYISMGVARDIIEGKVSSLNSTRYVLLELPLNDIPMYVEEVFYSLLIKGIIPIIAHPERNSVIAEDPNILIRYINNGALAQLNLPSLDGMYGNKTKSAAMLLLKHRLVHFVSTDSHSNKGRSPNVKKALDILKNHIDRDYYDSITCLNQELILQNKVIPVMGNIEPLGKRGIFRGIKRFLS